ncbi:hypothetical protein FSO04_43705 [Paraburkholderia madseniana]|uniref:Tetratricopeptide repeat protein n=1 Tax=Paraburkholderia madseniana TaxID=2599607 RepID=A0A6N6W072_9BURK|nr:hypothetical protein [Paraburkholderia madseniana]KAE8753701.1 hypothetical protein FSO04_43705 [Paraburkholderia madseniana]
MQCSFTSKRSRGGTRKAIRLTSRALNDIGVGQRHQGNHALAIGYLTDALARCAGLGMASSINPLFL